MCSARVQLYHCGSRALFLAHRKRCRTEAQAENALGLNRWLDRHSEQGPQCSLPCVVQAGSRGQFQDQAKYFPPRYGQNAVPEKVWDPQNLRGALAASFWLYQTNLS